MEEHLKKIKELLKFYKKNNIEIEFKVSYKGGTSVKGEVISKSIFNKWIVLQSESGSLTKIFLEDIEPNSIINSEFAKKENKNKDKETRDPISPKLRFEVFRRDKYVCQYCGAAGPKVELEVDHKIPVSRGGTDDIDNLTTACFKCNRGKGVSV